MQLPAYSPKIAFAGVAGVAFLAVCLLNLSWGLAAFALAAFGFFPIFPTPATAAAAILVGGWVINSIGGRELGRRSLARDRPGLMLLVGAFLLWSALSLIWAENPSGGWDVLKRLLPAVLLIPVAWSAIRNHVDASLIVVAIVVGALVAEVTGQLAPAREDISAEVLAETGRIGGIVGDPNELAAILLPALVLSVGLALGAAALNQGGSDLHGLYRARVWSGDPLDRLTRGSDRASRLVVRCSSRGRPVARSGRRRRRRDWLQALPGSPSSLQLQREII